MQKFILSSVLITLALTCHAQVYLTTTGKVEFFSDAPLENITAVNSTVSTLINTATDSIFVRIKNVNFVFRNALMQEHFNENYMESTKYPVSSFKGKISPSNYTQDGTYSVSATGKLTIHGVEKIQTINGTLTVKKGTIRLDAKFNVHTSDYKIEIPKLVFEKIAEEIKVTMSADYVQKK